MITVAMSIYNQSSIAWLAMESLCRQKTSFKWELIIIEDEKGAAGEKFYESYKDKLKQAGMINFIYKREKKHIGILQKIIKASSISSGEYIAKHDADNYHDKGWLENVKKMKNEGANIWSSKIGYFYNLQTKEIYKHYYNKRETSLAEIYKKELIENLPIPEDNIYKDTSYIWENSKKIKYIKGTGNYLYTEGNNHVYKERKNLKNIKNKKMTRSLIDKQIIDIIPLEVAGFLIKTR